MTSKTLQILIEAKDNASKTMGKMNSSLKKSKISLEQLSNSARIAGTAITGVGVIMSGMAIKSAVNFEKAMSDVNTLFDDNGEAANEMAEGIKSLLKTTPKNADDLGASAYAIVSAGITNTSDALKILEASAKLAVDGLGSTEDATTLMVLAQNNFKDSTLSAEEKANVLFKTVRNGITTVSDMSQSFGLLAPLFETVGGTLEEMSAATAALTQVNKSASISQNSLKAGLVAMSKPTAQATELFKKLGVDTFKSLVSKTGGVVAAWGAMQDATEGNTEQFAKAMGSGEALTSVISLLGSQSDSFSNSMASMADGSDALNEAYKKQTKTASAQYEILKNNLNVAMIELGNQILPMLLPLVERLTTFFENINTSTLKWVLGLTLIGGPLLLIIGFLPKIISGFGMVSSAVGILSKAFLALAANPIVLVIAGIALLAFIIYKNWDKIKAITISVWGFISNFLTTTWGIISAVIQSTWNILSNYFTTKLENIKNTFISVINFITGIIQIFLNVLGTDIPTYLTALKETIGTVLDAIQSTWEFIWGAIKDFFINRWDEIVAVVKLIGEKISNILKPAKETIVSAWEFIWNAVVNKTNDFIEKIKAPIKSVTTWIKDKIDGILNSYQNAKNKVSNFFGGISNIGAGITGLATGGIVTKPTLAMVGESGPEAVVPLSKLGSGIGGGGIIINVYGDVSGEDLIDKVKNGIMGDLSLNNNL